MIEAEDYHALASALAKAQSADDAFGAVRDLIGRCLGFRLLTMLMLTTDGDEVQRVFTTDPVNYPLAGRERLGTTEWGRHVLVDQHPYLGPDRAALRWAFPGDYGLIVSLGLGATMNVPVTALGKTLGSMNILDAEDRYGEAHLAAAASLAPHLAVPFLHWTGAHV